MRLLAIFWTLFTTSLFANIPLTPVSEPQSIAISYYTGKWIVSLEDGFFWELIPLKEKCQKTWSQWMWDETPKEWVLDESFFFFPTEWNSQDLVQVNETVELFEGYIYLIENLKTSQKAFAKPISKLTLMLPKENFVESFVEKPAVEARVIGFNHSHIKVLVLQDGSIWKVYPAEKNKASCDDYWKGIELDQPDPSFVFNLASWKEGEPLQLLCLEDEGMLTYLFKHPTHNQFLYASPLTLLEFGDLYLNYSNKEYQRGYSDGYASGSITAN